jgi:hypothetical protein
MDPSGCGMPSANPAVSSVAALPMSIWPQAMSCARPSSEMDLVSPVIACLVAVYAALPGRGEWAEIEPLLMIRPPRGACVFISRTACRAHRNAPVRFVSTTRCQSATEISSRSPGGAAIPALLTSRSTRPQRSRTASNSAATDSADVTSAGTTSAPPRDAAVSRRRSSRRPASATRQPSASSARATARPTPDPAPVTTATPVTERR